MTIWVQRIFLSALVLVQVCVVVGFGFWIRDSREQLAVQQDRHSSLTSERSDLESKIREQHAYRAAMTQDRSFLEHVAREKLGYAAADEWVFVIPDLDPNLSE